jgi:hypothetical protein
VSCLEYSPDRDTLLSISSKMSVNTERLFEARW